MISGLNVDVSLLCGLCVYFLWLQCSTAPSQWLNPIFCCLNSTSMMVPCHQPLENVTIIAVDE